MVIHVALSVSGSPPLQPGMPGAAVVPLVINTTGSLAGEDLAGILADRFACADAHAGDLPVARLDPGLRHLPAGSLLVAGQTRPPQRSRNRPPGLLLLTHTGPDAGRIVELVPGRYVLGRPGPGASAASGGGTRILIGDPAMSRVHAVLEISAKGVLISDCGSRNGLWLDGTRVRRGRLSTSSVVRTGDTLFQIRVPGAGPVRHSGSPAGPLAVGASVPRPPGAGAVAGAFLPLVMGIVLAAVTGMWLFLAFSGLGALTAVAGLLAFGHRRRKFARAAAAAAAADRRRLHALHPSAGDLAFAAMDSFLFQGASIPPPESFRVEQVPSGEAARTLVSLRLGTGARPANLVLPKPDEAWQPPVLRDVPVTLDARPGTAVSISGPAERVRGIFRSLLQQLGSRTEPERPGVVLLGAAADDFLSDARLLPGVRLLPAGDEEAAAAALTELASARPGSGLLVVSPQGSAGAARRIWNLLSESVRALTCLVVCDDAAAAALAERRGEDQVRISPGPGGGMLTQQGSTLPFLPDLVGSRAFHRTAVWLASRTVPGAAEPGGTPPPQTAGILAAWEQDLPPRAVLGHAAGTAVALDLVRDGPHILVAGTTGSGKSELLRTFVASLACQVPPARLNFLLIDFKGGSGLAPLAELPHTAGFLTDLSRENVARALTSLRAELKRRESLLAAARAGDLEAYNSSAPQGQGIPRLAVVVDEFRMLADTVPNAVEELMRIAALGRSLGLHLIMATQRPQGAVTADIRANVSACLCLRVRSAAESRDVVDCEDAAGFPSSAPGMAVLRLPGEPSLTFQSASTSAGRQNPVPPVQTLAEFLAAPAVLARPAPGPGLDRITSAVGTAASAAGFSRVQALLQPPLPEDLPALPAPPRGCLRIGLADRPEDQAQDWLDWNPRQHSHLALLGLPGAGGQAAASALARQHAVSLPARHLYVLDGDGSLEQTSRCAQTGAYVPPHETGRAARVLAVLSEMLLQRLAVRPAAERTGGEPGCEPGGDSAPGITVLVSGWGRWQEAFRSTRFTGAEESLLALVRDGAAADVCLLMTGNRELLGARFFQLITNRLWFPAGLSEDALLAWPRMPQLQPVPGRAFVQGPVVLGAAARSAAGAGSTATAQCYRHLDLDAPLPLPAGTPRPRRIEALPLHVRCQDLLPPSGPDRFPLGLGGDELETREAHVPPGSVFLVLGPPRSGRTTVLENFASSGAAVKVFRAGRGGAAGAGAGAGAAGAGAGGEPQGSRTPPPAGSLKDWLVLADDADQLSAPDQQMIARLADRGARVVLSAAPSFSLVSRLPLAARCGPARHGVLLAPAQPSDGEFFGVRVELEDRPAAGRGYLFTGGNAVGVQFAGPRAGAPGP